MCSSAKTLGDLRNGCDDQKMQHLLSELRGVDRHLSARIYTVGKEHESFLTPERDLALALHEQMHLRRINMGSSPIID